MTLCCPTSFHSHPYFILLSLFLQVSCRYPYVITSFFLSQ
nr:MAG TPA: hypothetical protein [Caudoviricetes sp.]